jgi:hypothetical protein
MGITDAEVQISLHNFSFEKILVLIHKSVYVDNFILLPTLVPELFLVLASMLLNGIALFLVH